MKPLVVELQYYSYNMNGPADHGEGSMDSWNSKQKNRIVGCRFTFKMIDAWTKHLKDGFAWVANYIPS